MSRPDRPESLPSRAPRAASDEARDPVDMTPKLALQEKRKRREPTVQLSLRVSQDVSERVVRFSKENDVTQRELIEMLVRENLPE